MNRSLLLLSLLAACGTLDAQDRPLVDSLAAVLGRRPQISVRHRLGEHGRFIAPNQIILRNPDNRRDLLHEAGHMLSDINPELFYDSLGLRDDRRTDVEAFADAFADAFDVLSRRDTMRLQPHVAILARVLAQRQPFLVANPPRLAVLCQLSAHPNPPTR